MTTQFAIYIIGYSLMIAGVAFGLIAAGVGEEWVTAVVLLLAGGGIVAANTRTWTPRNP